MCKWNENEKEGPMDCSVPSTHVTNLICIQKRMMTCLMNIDESTYELTGGEDD